MQETPLDTNQPPSGPINGEVPDHDEAPPAQPFGSDAWPANAAALSAQPFGALAAQAPYPVAQPAPAAQAAPPPSEAYAAPPEEAAGAAQDSSLSWSIEADGGSVVPLSTMSVLTNLSQKVSSGAVAEYQALPLGFSPLDRTLGGGIRAGEMMLIGGAQGTGKTTIALQMARNIALGGQASVLYVCFEHDEEYLLNRLVAMESVLTGAMPPAAGVRIQDVRREILGTWMAQGADEPPDLTANPRLRPALERIARYGQSLYLMRGSQTTTTVDNLRLLVERYRAIDPGRQLVVFVDYLQKLPVIPDPSSETEKVTVVVNALKDVALSQGVPLVSIVAADKEGLKAARLRNHHLRGSSAINYEADIILIMNEKYNIVAKANIEFNPYQAQRFRDWVVLTVEKNRAGQHSIDFEFEKHFEFSIFDPNGRQVQEKLIEERLYND
ncbi:MAG TPA: DnaB-like helicase C-terminal domain-containing protein [Candidatus Limnocylindria bacterium]|nr:DnaB-like helicase C-terminal domain-containing protein [Candidatus Limnocylindria bacterium]